MVDIASVLEGGIALHLSPADVNVAVRIVERLALQAPPPTSLSYGTTSPTTVSRRSSSGGGGGGSGGGSGGGKPGWPTVTDWPSTPVPQVEDAAFGFVGDILASLRTVMVQHLAAQASDAARATAAAAAAAAGGNSVGEGAGHVAPAAADIGARLASSVGRESLQLGTSGLRSGALAGMGAVGTKPSLCLVAGDALGARLLGWCTVACRSPQWRGLFSGCGLTPPAPQAAEPPPVGGGGATGAGVGTKRSAQDMEASAVAVAEGEEPGRIQEPLVPTEDPMDEDDEADGRVNDGGGRGGDDPTTQSGEGGKEPPGMTQLLCVVGQIVHAVQEHSVALAAARERAGGVGYFSGRVGGARGFDVRTRESSGAVQALVGALADAVLDVFSDHMVDPAVHDQLRGDAAKAKATATPGATPISDVVPLVDGASPAETLGLSIELVTDMVWLFSSLEPEAGAGNADGSVGGADRGSADKSAPATALLSSALSCWVSGRLLACMPGRSQLNYALGVTPPAASSGGAPLEGHRTPSIRPLPTRLACFAVNALAENVSAAADKGFELTESAALLQAGESTAALACAGRTTAFYRVALITEQMPAWRERRRQWHVRAAQSLFVSPNPRAEIGEADGAVGAAAVYDEAEVASAAGLAAAKELLDVLVALLCSAAEHDRVGTTRREHAEAAGAQRKPTVCTAGSAAAVIEPAMQAMYKLLVHSSSTSGFCEAGSDHGTSRTALLGRAKKRRGSSPGRAGGSASTPSPASVAAEARWAALAGLRSSACLDRVHLAGMLLAWEPWHPWMERVSGAATATATTGKASLSAKYSRSWQAFMSLSNQIAQACVSPRPPPPPGKGLAALVMQTVVSFRATAGGATAVDPVRFLDMPALLFLSKVSVVLHEGDSSASSRDGLVLLPLYHGGGCPTPHNLFVACSGLAML